MADSSGLEVLSTGVSCVAPLTDEQNFSSAPRLVLSSILPFWYRCCPTHARGGGASAPRACTEELPMAHVSITVNGKVRSAEVEPRLLLVHFLREQLNLTGTHVGCDTSQCGACTVHIDGRSAKSCTVLAVQADGCRGDDHRGSREGRPAAPAAGGLLGRARPAVRLLHAGHDHVGGQPAARQPARRPSSRSARASTATSAAAPATSTSSTPSSAPPARWRASQEVRK